MLNERAISALRAIFPTVESYINFASKSQNNKTIQSLATFAFRNNLIDKDNEGALESLVQNHVLRKEQCRPPTNMNFESFFDQKETLLDLGVSTRAMTERINNFITQHQIGLPKVSNSMLTRLKSEAADTPHKQNVLRTLAFWINYTRPNLALRWNFETLCLLCSEGKHSQDHKEGVRIGFALFSRGEVIDQETISWLKRNIKDYIETSITHFSYGRWGKIHSRDITTLYVDLPKEDSIASPSAYRRCLGSALSLAHQICLRWALSDQHTQNRFLSIGIAVGEYLQLDKHLYPILTAKLPSDPIIRLTDYARQCVQINGIRVLPCKTPLETTLFSGESLTIWWLVGFWSTLYFDFIPELLKDQILTNKLSNETQTSNMLWSPQTRKTNIDQLNKPNAISTFFRFPQNSLLGIEIAKTLFYRMRFWEAIEIIRIVLSLNPTNIIARTLRMLLLNNIALHAPSFATAQDLFAKAHNEALFIRKNCSFHSEDFYHVHAWVYLTQAMLRLRYLRKGKGTIEAEGEENSEQVKQQILTDLDKADSLFGTGEMVSSSGLISYYLQNNTKLLKAILKNNAKIFIDPNEPLDADNETINQSTMEFQWQTGHYQPNFPLNISNKLKVKMSKKDFLNSNDLIALSAYKPALFFGSAVAIWDFFPIHTSEKAKLALQFIHKASAIAESLSKKNIGIFSFTRIYGEMIAAEKFIAHLDRSIKMIKEQASEKLDQQKKTGFLRPKSSQRQQLLFTLNF